MGLGPASAALASTALHSLVVTSRTVFSCVLRRAKTRKMVSSLLLSVSLLASAAVAAPKQPSYGGGYKTSDWVKGKAFDRVAIIWLENTD